MHVPSNFGQVIESQVFEWNAVLVRRFASFGNNGGIFSANTTTGSTALDRGMTAAKIKTSCGAGRWPLRTKGKSRRSSNEPGTQEEELHGIIFGILLMNLS